MTAFSYHALQESIEGLDCVLVVPRTADGEIVPPRAMAVFCHGYGASGQDLVGLAHEILPAVPADAPVALVYPEAPIDLTDAGLPGGRAWWQLSIQSLLTAMEEGQFEQIRMQEPEEIDAARNQVVAAIEILMERFKLGASTLLLGGFSQGAMLSVDVASRGLSEPPAALALYSGALICEKHWKKSAGRLNATQIVQSHGSLDPILPLQTGKWLREMLEESGCTVQFIEFAGPHTIPPAAVEQSCVLLNKLVDHNSQ
ncbi:MAG TPA: lysophospholipase [Planctomycetaceae bacterium]|nr:lysophospholipase [Planctomycetaceae bacterium]